MIKQIVLQIGRKIVDFLAWFEIGIIAIAAIALIFFIWASEMEMEQKVTMSVIVLFVGLILFLLSIMFKYFTYLLIDIRDNTAKLAEVKDGEFNKNIIQIFMSFIAIIIAAIVAGLFFCGINYVNKTLLDKEGNFTLLELNNKIKQVGKYNDFATIKTYGFSYDPENTNSLKIVNVLPKSSAEKEGLKIGDVIVKVNNYDISNNYDEKKLRKIFKRNKKIKIAYSRNNNIYSAELTKSDIQVPNLPDGLTMKIYINSLDIKNNYSSGVFKFQDGDNLYQKELIVCDCNPEHKTIMSIWNASYSNGNMVNEYNALKNKTVNEEMVIPHTHGEVKWMSTCYYHNNNYSDEQKKRIIENLRQMK